MGPADGPSEVLIHRRGTSPLAAAVANAASSHFAEQDDLHNSSVFHPATVVLALRLAVRARPQRRRPAGGRWRATRSAFVSANFSAARTTRCSTPPAQPHTGGGSGRRPAAGLSPEQMAHAFGSAGTQSAGLWEFLRDAVDSKQPHGACSRRGTDGRLPAGWIYGAQRILDGAQGMAAGMSSDADASRLTDRLGTRWALAKRHSSSMRRAGTHPAADALQQLMRTHGLAANDLAAVTALRAPGRDRRARAGGRSADRAPVEVLDGHRARNDRGSWSSGRHRVR